MIPNYFKTLTDTLTLAGVNDQGQGTQIGLTKSGIPLYSTNNKDNPDFGAQTLWYKKNYIKDLDSGFDVNSIPSVGKKSQVELLNQAQDEDSFNSAFRSVVGDDSEDAKAIASEVFPLWKGMASSQKSTVLAGYTINKRDAEGNTILDKPIKDLESSKFGNMTYRRAIQLEADGVNTAGVVKNWDELNNLQAKLTGSANPDNVHRFAQDSKLLGVGKNNETVDFEISEKVKASGFREAPQYGPGAYVGKSDNNAIPRGYEVVNRNDKTGTKIIAPAAYAQDIQEAIPNQTDFTNYSNTNVADLVINGGSLPSYEETAKLKNIKAGWGDPKGKREGVDQILHQTAKVSPALGAVSTGLIPIAFGDNVIKDKFGSGKSGEQKSRDAVRARLKDTGVYSKDWTFEDANGQTIKVGQDGKSGKFSSKDGKELNAYDVDNSNPLAVKISGHTRGLMTILTGGAQGTNVDQVNGELTNAALGNKNLDNSEDNYKYSIQNVRKMYANSGVTRKDQALQLMNIAYNEKRIDHSTYIQTKNSLTEIFGNDKPKSNFVVDPIQKPSYITNVEQFNSVKEKNKAKFGAK
jgi:hypothetical protein